MGLLNMFRALKNSAKAGGAFGYVAQNIAIIYYVIKESKFGKQLNEDQLLFATALCDTEVYIQLGQISIEDIKDAVMYAHIQKVEIFPYSVIHGSLSDIYKNKYLISLAMQIEALIFNVDSYVNYRDIVDAVIRNKPKITNVINKTLEEKENCNIYPTVFINVTSWIRNADFQNLVLSFDINNLILH